jgi:hypothetical protein
VIVLEPLTKPLTLTQVREQQRPDGTLVGVIAVPLSHLVDHAPMESDVGFIDVLVAHFIEGDENNSASSEDTQMLGPINYRVVGHDGKETLHIEITADVRSLLDTMNGAPTKARFRLDREIENAFENLERHQPEISAQCHLALITSDYAAAYTHPASATDEQRLAVLAITETFRNRIGWISSIQDRLKTYFRPRDTHRVAALAVAGIALPIEGLTTKSNEELASIFGTINNILCPPRADSHVPNDDPF